MNKLISLGVVLIFLSLCMFTDFSSDSEPGINVSEESVVSTVESTVTEPPEVTEPMEFVESTEITEPEIKPTEVFKGVTEPTEIPEETVEETEFVSYYTYTEEELDLLARLIYSEGGTESYETKLKIGSVVMNRVSDLDSPDFPDTIREVIYQKRQFSVTTHRINGVIMIDRPADEESRRAAKEVLDYGSVLPLDVQVFYASWCKEGWVTSREIYGTFDNTVFAYIYPKR